MAKTVLVAVLALSSLIYIINPTAGIFELIPDNLPFIGNLDEATATAILLACMRYYGWDPTKLLGKPEKEKEKK